MILLLKCEAPDQMLHRFKNSHSFLCKSFVKCHVSDLLYNTTICTVGDNTEACKKTKLQIKFPPCQRKEVRQCCQAQQSQIGRRAQSPGSLTVRPTRKTLWRLRNADTRELQERSTKERGDIICFHCRLVLSLVNFDPINALT